MENFREEELELGAVVEENEGQDLSYFFPEVAEAKEEVVSIMASPRFKDKDGNTILWKFRLLKAGEISKIKQKSTKVEKRGGQKVIVSDSDATARNAILESIVYPNLASKALQDKYKVYSERGLLEAMLTGPELERLSDKVLKEQGFVDDINVTIESAKN